MLFTHDADRIYILLYVISKRYCKVQVPVHTSKSVSCMSLVVTGDWDGEQQAMLNLRCIDLSHAPLTQLYLPVWYSDDFIVSQYNYLMYLFNNLSELIGRNSKVE